MANFNARPDSTFGPQVFKPLGLGLSLGVGSKEKTEPKPARTQAQAPATTTPTVLGIPKSVPSTMDANALKTSWVPPAAQFRGSEPVDSGGTETESAPYKYKKIVRLEDFSPATPEVPGLDAYRQPLANQQGYREAPRASDKNKLKGARLTWKEYDRLSDDQKKAVDFNGLLVDAREKDLRSTQGPWSEEKLKQYQQDVTDMFGESGGSDTIAINTVALLKSIDFQAVGQDLDDYLSLDRAITADELKDFKLSNEPVVQGTPASVYQTTQGAGPYSNMDALKTPENLAAVDSLAITRSADLIEAAMTDGEKRFWSVATAVNPVLPTEQNIKDIPYGFGGDIRDKGIPLEREDGGINWTFDRFYRDSWNRIKGRDASTTLDQVEQFFVDYKFSPGQRRQWYRTMYQRAMNEKQYGSQALIDANGVEIPGRTPDEIIEFLKLGGS